MSFLNKVNVLSIVKNHLKTIVNDNTGKPSFDDIFTFLFLPIIISGALLYFNKLLTISGINIIIASMSIGTGFLINAIVLIFDIIKRESGHQIKNKALRQIMSNISFAILLSISIIVISALTCIKQSLVFQIINFVLFLFISEFLLTVLMVLKRIHILFKKELDSI